MPSGDACQHRPAARPSCCHYRREPGWLLAARDRERFRITLARQQRLAAPVSRRVAPNPTGGRDGRDVSAGALSAFVLVVYGSWAPALAAGEPFSPLVPGAVGKSAMEYTTAAALAVTVGVVLSSSVYAIARGPGIRVDHRPVVLSSRWWPGVLLMEAIGLCFFVAYNVSSHQPLVSLALFRPSRQTSPKAQPQPTTSFSTEGSMCLSARRFTASDFFWLKVYRLRGSALIAGNLFLYTTIGFVYRIVVTMIRLVETSTPNPRVFRGAGARLK